MAVSRDTAGLECLVAGPYHWNSVTYSGFIRDAYDNVIKAEVERLQKIEVIKRTQVGFVNNGKSENLPKLLNVNQNFDLKIAKLVKSLINESGQVLGKENWTDVIGTELWNILKLDEHGQDRYKLDNENNEATSFKKKSVVQLLKFIRNKISHIRSCKDEMKEKLKQFFNKDKQEQYHFNENKFIQLWIFKFPKLVPFLWIKLYKFRDKLVNYYPDYEIDNQQLKHSLLDVNKWEKVLKIALITDMENGNVQKRFKGPGYSIEFRGLNNLAKVLDRNNFIRFDFNSRENVLLSVSHSSTVENKLDYVGKRSIADELIVYFTDNIFDDKLWKLCSNCDCRIIVFCDIDKLTNEIFKEAVSKFKHEYKLTEDFFEFPIKGTELSVEKQNWLFEKGQVCIQGRYVKLKEIISNSGELLEVLSGNLLNKLLRQEKPVICANYKYPEYNGVYITRRLYFTDSNGKKPIHMKEELEEEDYLFENEILDKFRTKKVFAKCVSIKKARKAEVIEESDLLKRLRRKNTRVIFFLAESGMGKSKLLLCLGKMVKNSLVIFSSFREFASLLKKTVGTRVCGKIDIKCVLKEILGCKDKCEENLIYNWLEQKWTKGAKIEMQLDGLDEVPSGNWELALRIIEKDLHAVRVWLTSNKPFPNAEREFRFTYCGILPFSYKDKMDFFEQACRLKGFTEDEIDSYIFGLEFRLPTDKELVNFLDYPLNCSMLFELNGKDIGTFAVSNGGIGSDLFDALYRKKFTIMYREKKGIHLEEEDVDFKIQRETYLQFHTQLALVHLFPSVAHQFSEPPGMQFFTKEIYQKMGIIINSEPVTFIHRKYADFFVAKYIIKVLETGKPDVVCPEQLFIDMLSFGTPEKDDQQDRPFIWKFVDEQLKKISNWDSLKWLETYTKSHDINSMSTEKKISRFLVFAFGLSLWNLAKLLIHLWLNKTDTIFCNKILLLAVILGAKSDWVINMCQTLSFDNQNELLMHSVKQGHYDLAKYLIEEKCDDDVFDRISELRENGGGILHCIVDHINHRHPHTAIGDLISADFVENTTDFIRFVLSKSAKEIERKDSRGRNVLLALPLIQKGRPRMISEEHIFPLKEFLINELNEDVNETSADGDSILSMELDLNYQYEHIYSTDCLYKNFHGISELKEVDVYHNTLELVTSKKFVHVNLKNKTTGLTPLGEAVHFFGSDLKEKTLKLIRDEGADFNVLDGEGNTILHYCVKNCDDVELIKRLVNYSSKIDVKNGGNLCALCLAEKEGKSELIKFFRKTLRLRRKQNCTLNCANE